MVEQYNQEIADWLDAHRAEIEQGSIRVFAVDESHLQAGDICGYGWGNRQQRRAVEVENYRDSQTYFGALDCLGAKMVVKPYARANSDTTIDFVQHLQSLYGEAKLVLIWDGASYHRSEAFRQFLSHVNPSDEEWQVHCLRLPPYAPQENPIENVWGQLKFLLQQLHLRCQSFTLTKQLFQFLADQKLFSLPDLSSYNAFSCLI